MYMSTQKEKKLEAIKRNIEMAVKELNATTACFSGYRNQKLPWRGNEEDARCILMKRALHAEIIRALQRGYRTFLCGMARGFDIICAEMVLSLKKNIAI